MRTRTLALLLLVSKASNAFVPPSAFARIDRQAGLWETKNDKKETSFTMPDTGESSSSSFVMPKKNTTATTQGEDQHLSSSSLMGNTTAAKKEGPLENTTALEETSMTEARHTLSSSLNATTRKKKTKLHEHVGGGMGKPSPKDGTKDSLTNKVLHSENVTSMDDDSTNEKEKSSSFVMLSAPKESSDNMMAADTTKEEGTSESSSFVMPSASKDSLENATAADTATKEEDKSESSSSFVMPSKDSSENVTAMDTAREEAVTEPSSSFTIPSASKVSSENVTAADAATKEEAESSSFVILSKSSKKVTAVDTTKDKEKSESTSSFVMPSSSKDSSKSVTVADKSKQANRPEMSSFVMLSGASDTSTNVDTTKGTSENITAKEAVLEATGGDDDTAAQLGTDVLRATADSELKEEAKTGGVYASSSVDISTAEIASTGTPAEKESVENDMTTEEEEEKGGDATYDLEQDASVIKDETDAPSTSMIDMMKTTAEKDEPETAKTKATPAPVVGKETKFKDTVPVSPLDKIESAPASTVEAKVTEEHHTEVSAMTGDTVKEEMSAEELAPSFAETKAALESSLPFDVESLEKEGPKDVSPQLIGAKGDDILGEQEAPDMFFGTALLPEDSAVLQRIKARKEAKEEATSKEITTDPTLKEQLQAAAKDELDEFKRQTNLDFADLREEFRQREKEWREKVNDMKVRMEVAEELNGRTQSKMQNTTEERSELESQLTEWKDRYARESPLWTDRFERERRYRRQEQIAARERLARVQAEARETLRLAKEEGRQHTEMIREELSRQLSQKESRIRLQEIELNQLRASMEAKDTRLIQLQEEHTSLRQLAGEAWGIIKRRTKRRWTLMFGRGERKTERVT